LRELSDRRGFGMESFRPAQRREFLHFTGLFDHAAWCLTEARRELYEFRRVDGAKWPAYGRLSERKAPCIGTGKAWPIGTLDSQRFERVVWCEGASDFLAALSLIVFEQQTERVAPATVLGASRLAPEALAHFKGKIVCIFLHLDEAGRKAVREWARQLKDAGASRVIALDLSGLVCADGCEGKDLCDLLRIHPDCFESAEGRNSWEVMP
jgi:hypothetical protein